MGFDHCPRSVCEVVAESEGMFAVAHRFLLLVDGIAGGLEWTSVGPGSLGYILVHVHM